MAERQGRFAQCEDHAAWRGGRSARPCRSRSTGDSAVTSISERSTCSAMLLAVGLGALDQERAEVGAAIGQQRDRLGQVVDDQRLVDVHLEVAAGAAEADRHVVGHHLDRDHGQRLGLGRIDLARHDRGARLVLRQDQLRQARRAARRPAGGCRWRSCRARPPACAACPRAAPARRARPAP